MTAKMLNISNPKIIKILITVQNKKYQKLKILSQINRNYGLNVNLKVCNELGITVTTFEILNPKN